MNRGKGSAELPAALLATIGYEGASLEQLLAALQAAGVTTVLDIREVPWSRRMDFAKSRLSPALAGRGILYLHRKALGTPKPGREAAKTGDRETFERILGAQLDSAEGQEALVEAAALARQGGLCLLCYEHDPAQCHRSAVAARLAALAPLAIRHLDPNAGPDQRS